MAGALAAHQVTELGDRHAGRPHIPPPRRVYRVMTMKEPFERVVAAHGATVLRVCRAVLGVHADADDAWSDTFLAALGAYPDLPADANVQAWLVTIAHRKAIDVIRARSRMPVAVADLPDRPSTIGRPDAGDLDLWAAVRALPAK